MGATAIAKMLNDTERTSRFGNCWGQRSIMAILRNYTYTGNLLLQKKYTVDFLTKTMKVNEGEVHQYYVENSHPAIIQPAEWEAVQVEMEQHRYKGKQHNCKSPFSRMIFCGGRGYFVLCVPIVPTVGVSPPTEFCEKSHEPPCRSVSGMQPEI